MKAETFGYDAAYLLLSFFPSPSVADEFTIVMCEYSRHMQRRSKRREFQGITGIRRHLANEVLALPGN